MPGMHTTSSADHLRGSASRLLNELHHQAAQLLGPAEAFAPAESDRRRADKERRKADRERRRRAWDDQVRPLQAWAAGTDVLLAAMLLTHGLHRRGRDRRRAQG
jgi:hypothetical protein